MTTKNKVMLFLMFAFVRRGHYNYVLVRIVCICPFGVILQLFLVKLQRVIQALP